MEVSMGKKKLLPEDDVYANPESMQVDVSVSKKRRNAASSSKAKKPGKDKPEQKSPGSKKMAIELVRETWDSLEMYIEAYNSDPDRSTPKTDVEHVIHEALAIHLGSNAKG
jgi:hypothetical protein